MNQNVKRIVILLLVVICAGVAAPYIVRAQATDDWSRAQAAGKIVFGTSADYAPFESYNNRFEIDGFDIALARELGKRLGVNVEFNDFAFGGLLDALELGQVDAAISAISVTQQRQQVVDFTNLYYVDDDAVLTLKTNPVVIRGATDFANLRVGVERGTTYYYWAHQNLVEGGIIPQSALVEYSDTVMMVRGLRMGEVDAVLMGRLPAFVNNMSSTDLYPAGRGLNVQRLAIAVRKGSTLVDPLNQALLAIQADGTYAELVSTYLNVDKEKASNDTSETEVVNGPTQLPDAIPICVSGMAFVTDLNLDDLNMTAPPVMALGQAFSKGWRIRNSGTCAWEPDYALIYMNGNRPEASMGAQPLLMGRRVEPGETIDLSISLQAPSAYGVFQAFYQMRDNTGKLFGEVIWAGIQVPDPNPPVVPPTPTPVPPQSSGQLNPNFRADAGWVNPGQCTALRWEVDNVSSVYFVDAGNVQGVGGHDSRTVCPGSTATFVLRVVRTDGVTVEFPLTINVNGQSAQQPGPNITRFRADRNEVNFGQCVNFEWRTDNADGVNLYRSGNRILSNGPREGSEQDCPPDGRSDYRLEAYGNGNVSQTISVHADSGRHRDE